MRRPIVVLFLIAYLVTLLGLTLGGFYQPRATRNWMPFRSIAHDLRAGGSHLVVNLIGNLVAFLPMGLFVPSMRESRRPIRDVLLWSFALSLSIETLQGLSGRRVADVDDLILNTIGGLVGYGLGMGWRSFALRRTSASEGGCCPGKPVVRK